MKKLLTLAFVLCLFSINAAQAQNPVNSSSDEAALPYNVQEVISEVDQAINNPTEYNQYVTDFMKKYEFPADGIAEVKKKWIIENPDKIEKLLIARKKNNDKYYMPLIKE